MKASFILILLLLSLPSWGQFLQQSDCSNTDIRETNPHIRDNPKMVEFFSTPRDQDSIGWCFGFTAADLMSAETGAPISAVHSSVLYNKSIEKSFFKKLGYDIADLFRGNSFDDVYQGGFTSSALKTMIKNKKICSEEDLPFDKDFGSQTYLVIRALENLKKDFKDNKVASEQLCQGVDRLVSGLYMNKIETDKIAASLMNEDINLTLSRLADEVCADKMLSTPKLKVRKITSASSPNSSASKGYKPSKNVKTSRFLHSVNKVLDKGKPLEMSYNVKHFTDNNGLHSSVVMGRRWNNGRCEYRVRNSWGESCAFYKSNIDCEQSTGTFWITDEDFAKAANSITYLD